MGKCERTDIDLHMHSLYSDGTDSLTELVRRVREAGIRTFALTDHDTVEGAMKLEQLLKEENTPVKPEFYRGIEFSCIAEDLSFKCHILGYLYDPGEEHFRRVLEEDHALRIRKTESRIAYLKDRGIDLSEEDLSFIRSMTSPGKPHLADILVKSGYAPDRQAGIDMIHTREKIRTRVPAEQALEGILKSGGLSVWAHPLGGEGESHLTREEFRRRLEYLLPGLSGLECWYSRYSEDEVRFLLSEAEKHHLLVSGGSDYHGKRKNIAPGELNSFGKAVRKEQLTLAKALHERKNAASG